jgi:hypothetical protein
MNVSLVVDGHSTQPLNVTGDIWHFAVRSPAHSIRLVSGAARPADITGVADTRVLGVAVAAMRWRMANEVLDQPVELPDFIDGFYPVEVDAMGNGLFRWTTGDAGLPQALFPPWNGWVGLELSLREWAGSARSEPATTPAGAAAAALGAFQSLGMDCEFGFAQRAYGVEPPLTLFRWSGTSLERLLAGLSCEFAGLGDPGELMARWDGREYVLRTPFLTLHTGHHTMEDADGVDEVLRAGRATLRLLRRKLLADIRDPDAIFICKCKEPGAVESDMRRLHGALRAIGPAATLLCVTIATPDRRGGEVVPLADGLLVGYVDRFTLPTGPYDQWADLCANALRHHRHVLGRAA